MSTARGEAIYVALHDRNEAVEVKLPADADDVLNMLSLEAAPIQCWLDAAKAFLSRAKVDAFYTIIDEANSEDVLTGIQHIYAREPKFERIQLLCALAAYYLEAARVERDLQNKDQSMKRAADSIAAAENISQAEMLPVMAKGVLALARNDTTAAMADFRRAASLRHNGSKNHAPLLAQAAIHYNSGNLAAALNLYVQVLRENPSCPAEVRLGIGACYYRAGRLEAAAAAYNRVLQLDPSCADALLGLAIIKLGSRNVQEGLNAGLQLLQRAYTSDPSHPGVLIALSHFSLLKGMNEQALRLAATALEGADTDRLRVAGLTLLGRCHHALGDLSRAQHFYAQAIRLDPKLPLPHLGTAQVYLAAGGDPANVVSELELVLRALPGNGDALMLLGGLMPALPERVSKTLAAHREAASRQLHDAALQEILGELLAAQEPSAALVAFDQALSLHRAKQQSVLKANEARAARRQALLEQQQQGVLEAEQQLQELGEDEEVPLVPAKVLNNTAVLKYRSGDVSTALSLMREATQTMMQDGTPAMHKVTIGFNIARLQEATGDLKSAAEGYQSLVQQFPSYVDCYLRLAAMAKAAGEMDKAREYAAAATRQAGGDIDAQALLATVHLQRGDLPAARECVSKAELSSPAAKRDPYMLLVHANVVIGATQPEAHSRMNQAEQKKHTDLVFKALDMYKSVLKQQHDNIYAVNGIGTCMAELGYLAAAKSAFDEVIRATSKTKGFVKLPETYINLGHLCLAKKQYGDALRMYEHASRLHNHKDIKVLMLMARTYHDAGDHLNARKCLLKGLHLAPMDPKLRFNLAFVLQEMACKTFFKYGETKQGGDKHDSRKEREYDPNKMPDYERSIAALEQAERIFRHLRSQGREVTKLDNGKLKKHAEFCAEQVPKAKRLHDEALTEHNEFKAKEAVRRAMLVEAKAQREYQEQAANAVKAAEKQRKLAEAQKVLEASQATLAVVKQKLAIPAGTTGGDDGGEGGGNEGGKAKSRKRKKTGGGAAAENGEFYVDDAAPIERVPKKKDVKAELKRGGLDSDDEEEVPDGIFGSDDPGNDWEPDQQQDSDNEDAGGDNAGQQQQRRSGGGSRLKRRAAAAAGEEDGAGGGGGDDEDMGDEDWGGGGGGEGPADEGLGESDAGHFQVDALFTDEQTADDEAGGAQQPRKRQRQTLASDDEDDVGGAGAEAAGNGAASEDMDELF